MTDKAINVGTPGHIDHGTPQGASELKAMLERIHDDFLSALHETSGICGHCGKRFCAGRASNSGLPKTLNTEDAIAAMAVAISKASSNAKLCGD